MRARRLDSRGRQQVHVVHQHLGIRLPRKRVDTAIRQAKRREHRRGRALAKPRRGRDACIETHDTARANQPRQKRRGDVRADVGGRLGDDRREQHFLGRAAGGQRLHTHLHAGVLGVPLLGERDWRATFPTGSPPANRSA